jgi:hypothetical protein
MALQQIRALRLEPAQVETAADFFEAYASYILSRVPRDSISEANLIDAASSLRSAGQWAMLFDIRRAADLLSRAAEIWHDMGYGFGTFVLAAISPRRLNRDEMIGRLVQIAKPYVSRDVARRFGVQEPQTLEPLLHPQQQAYLLMAGAAMWQRLDFPLDLLRAVGDQSPHRRGVAPIGSLGTPLRLYWDIARRFLGSDDEQSAASVAGDLARMGTAYAQSIDSAMANERLWFNAAAPVDVGDIDIVGIALVGAQRLGSNLMLAHLRSTTEDLDAIARVPLELAGEMIGGNHENVNTDRL